MATLLTLLQELGDRANLDMTVAANKTRGIRQINLIQQDIASRSNYDWLYKRAYIQTVVDRTAGTVAVTNGTATITGTNTAFAATDKRCFIQLQNDLNWYEVTVVASQVLTISNNFQGETLTAGTYTLRTVYYDLPSDLFKVFDARQSNTPAKLTNLGVWTTDHYRPDLSTTAVPRGYFVSRIGPDIAATSAKQQQMVFYPSPDDEYNIEVRYFLEQADLSADADIPFLPVPYHSVLIDGAEWLGAKFLNSSNQEQLKKAYEFGLATLISKESEHGDFFPILGSSDMNWPRFLPFPQHYENGN